jgi:hypothetical protein
MHSEAIDTVIFEVTEASPRAKDVLATDNALQWDFPGRAAEIPAAKFFKQTFQDSLATLLEKASVEDLGRFAARSSKAGVSVAETRDTTDPSLISQMLLPLLEAVGSPIDVLRIRKRVRDDVNIDAAELPWRRLPLWLVLRVASQRQLCLALGNDIGRACYKFLMCTVLAELLRDCTGQLAPALTMILCDKLCRRLAKLEMDKARAPSARPTYDGLFDSVGVMATKIIEQSSEQIRSAWDRLKRSMTRPVQVLPQRADNLALRLSLPLSNSHLSGLIAANKQRLHGTKLRMAPPPLEGSLRQVMLFTDRYFKLAQIELGIERDPRAAPGDAAGCKELAGSIRNFMAEVGDAYEADPEQMSLFILNVFDLWVRMDKCAARACPLLLDYAPVFSPELLDVLQLPTLSSLRRLQDIQTYLLTRHENCTFHDRTILQLGPDCFAAQYAERSDQLRDLREEIESASAKSRHKKEREWKEACEAYDDLCQKIAESVCICTTKYDGSRNGKGCKKCGGYARRNRMKIAVHEDRLPKDNIKAAAVVFELQIPGFLAAYRNATFRILIDLGYPSRPATSSPPAALLRGYPPLQAYARPTPGGVVLASAKKSFLQTHYKISKLKGDVSKVILPLGLDFSYYDTTSGVWLKDLDKPTTFQHVCGIRLPRCLSTVIPSSPHPAPVIPGPQSYDIIASQTRCPQDTSVHEFMGYQRLLSGESTRWLTMLVELGASNLNFSAKDTMLLLNDLAIQAGPAASGECLRRIHVAFRDGPFCERLAEQISNRLHGISASWREVHCMELLLTLSLRLFSLTSGRPREAAEQLLKAARELTLQWVVRLREESINAGDADAAERAATYGMWASLLCRRTFAALVESGSEMAGEDLCSFVQASVALQQNLVVDLTKLPRVLKNMLIRDVKMVHALRPALEDSIARNPDSLGAAINETWCDSSNSTGREFSPWRALEPPYDRWFVSAVSSSANPYYVPQAVHYNFIEGHLLLDGKPLGRLPLDIRNSEDVRELFENQHLLTFPSSLDGMSHALATRIKGNEVHFGHRGDAVIIRALYRGDLLEYVPRRVFIRGETADLPLGLVDNCVHWLNHRTKRLEIRRKPSVWKTRQRDWNLNVVTGRAQRGNVFLVDPQSQLCQSVAAIFRHFEDPRRLTVYQPTAGALSVEMRHLELSFFVNGGGLLQCRELREEIDPDQDAGTLYGFQSAIVLRGVANPECRSVIAPLGRLAYKRHGMHVAVRSSSTNDYGRFIIDDVLGRLSCAPEPRLLFAKAQFHALTSSFVPDPLTGRTGTEEALHILSSGSCQPWTVLGESPVAVLHAIQALSPGRAYYPKDQRRLQAVTWDEHLPLTTQDDRFEPLVQAILAKSDRLKAFTAPGDACSATAAQTPIHLRNRGRTRRLLYERRTTDVVMPTASCDRIYTPRDRDVTLPQASNVYRTARLLLERPLGVSSEKKLADILQSWSVIGGFQDNSDRSASCLSDLMEDDIGPQWGALLNLCRRTDDGEPYELVFRLGLLAFGTKPDMHAIRSLAAFGTIDELKTLEQPSGACFTGFKAAESPQLDVLQDLIEMDHPRSKATRSSRHQEDLEAERGELALFLLQQWPCPAASLEGFTPTTGTRLSLKRVSVEWQRLYQNWQLSKYVMRAQEILDAYRSHADGTGPRQWKPAEVFCAADRGAVVPALSCIVKNPGPIPSGISHPAGDVPGHSSPIDSCNRCPGMECSLLRGAMITREAVELGSILGPFISSDDALRSQYGGDLQESLCAFMHARSRPTTCDAPRDINVTDADIVKARTALRDRLEQIQARFRADDNRYPWLQRGGMWPCITTSAILELIRSSSNHDFGCGMREALVSYGVQVTGLQRLVRLRDAQLREDHGKVQEEWLNAGHDNWNPLECPDWLLFEVDSNILIRPEQVDVARAIISPASGSNSSLQMNMGKGRSRFRVCYVTMGT